MRHSTQLPSGTRGLPLIGEFFSWRQDPLRFLRARYERFGRVFISRTYGYPEITMLGPEANEFILSSHRDLFEWGGGQSRMFDPRLFGRNLFVLDHEPHDRLRKLIVPAFHGRALKSYFDAMMTIARSYAESWAKAGQIAAYDELRKLTFQVSAKLLLGAETGEQTAFLSKIFDSLGAGMQTLLRWNLPWTRFGKAIKSRTILEAYIGDLIKQRRDAIRDDVLTMLLSATDENGGRLDEREIASQLMTLVAAAHDTTTSALTWTLYEVGRHPGVKEKLRSELAEVSGGSSLEVEHLSRLRYLDRVLKEVERIHPAVTGGLRKVVKGFEFDGFLIPAGSIVYYSILFTHMMAEVFEDPERFDPERFAPPRSEDERTPFSLIGFGGGPRSCIGQGFARMEMKVILSTLLNEYEWRVIAGQDLRSRYSITKRPNDGLHIEFWKQVGPMISRRISASSGDRAIMVHNAGEEPP